MYWINSVYSGAILDTGFTKVSPYTVFLLSKEDSFANIFKIDSKYDLVILSHE